MAKNTNRDEFSAPTKRLLEKQSGHHCSNPSCRGITSAASSDGKTTISIGEASHITAAAPGGPRYNASLTSDERKSLNNGIWLCKDCAKAIDSKDPYFTEKLLIEWKRQANEATWRSIVEKVPFPPAPTIPTDEELRARLKQAATADLAVFRKADTWPSSTIPLTLKIDQIRDPLSTDALAKAVTTFEDLILVAAPGMGKTTTIFQLANGVVNAQAGSPIIVPLGEWATLQDSLLGSVLKRATYSGISETDLHRAAGAPGVVLLLDGWNELNGAARERARVEITRLKAELPELGLVISTRRQALDIPFGGTRVDLLSLGGEQQMAIAREIRGETGERLVDQAWRSPGVRELVSIPLYLTSLLALPDGQPFPTTKEEVLRRFVSAFEQDAGSRAALMDGTEGFPELYLERLAVTMTADANTSVTDTAARRVVNSVSRNLVETDQLSFVSIQPNELLNTLVSAHVLVRSGDTAGISFQHQQFQEWFASHEVERLIAMAVDDPVALDRLRAEMLDRRPWTEAILFAVERTARGDEAQQKACTTAILAALGVDPMLAAEMIFRANDAVWNAVAGEVQSRLQRWHTPGKLDRAFRFMISTGRPEFIDLLWPQLTHESDQIHLSALRAVDKFRPSVLGNDAAERLAGLPASVRRHVLSEIASNSGMDGLDLVTAVAKADADLKVKVSVADALSFRRADRHLSDLLCDADDSVYDSLVRKSYIEGIGDAAIQARLTMARERQKAAGLSPGERLNNLIWTEPSEDISSEIIAFLTSLDIDGREDNHRGLIWELNERYPEAVAEAVLNRLRAGHELFYGADDILAASHLVLEEDDLLKIALSETNSYDDKANAAASVLGPKAVGAMIDAYLDVRSKLRDGNGSFNRAASDRYSILRRRLSLTRGESLVAAVVTKSDAAKDVELAHLAALFSWRPASNERRERPFDADDLDMIGKLAQTWADRLLAADDIPRYDKAAIASMIQQAPAATLLPTLQRLLDDNLRRYHEFREAAKASKWRDSNSVREAQNPHTHEYQAAMIAIHAPETFKVAASYLTDEHFGKNAARVLAVQWINENDPTEDRSLIGGVDFSGVSARRAARQAKPEESCPEANAIFTAVETLIAEGTTEEQQNRAVVLGCVGARLPHGDCNGIFEKLIALAERQSRAALLLSIVLSGEEVSIDLIAAGIEETIDEANTKAWILTDGDGYQLRDWLRLLPFATPIAQIPKIISSLPDAHRSPRMLEEMIRNICLSSPEGGQSVLFKLAENDPRLFQDYQWRKSAMNFGGDASARRIVDLVLSGNLNEKTHDQMRLRDELADLLRDNPDTRAYVHDLLLDGPRNNEQALLARSLAQHPSPDDILLLVKCEIATKRSFLGWRSVEVAVTTRVPSEDWRGAYEVVPVPSTLLRKELLALTVEGGKNDPAARCLTEIDKARDRYSAPESEPRHPDLSSGRPWPIHFSNPDVEDGE
ncbi:NACHT domain-containing protein [Pseudophaeobacter arcticus]|uniref:NACHT domain-containing protein n=1 Tax=Pseudophaeobacter arcticus TaxID=385492 RepID=UPI000412A205|nr:hypothetical protein [Pseudophaeobacter arcticus]